MIFPKSVTIFATFISSIASSDLEFTASVSHIQPPVTRNLRLRCSLKDTNMKQNVIVGKRDLVHTDDNIMYVTAILITHGGVDVASISEHVAAQSQTGAANMAVTGTVDHSTGFLQLDWAYPSGSDVGEYECDVTAVDKKGHSYVFTKTLEVQETDITISDLSTEVGVLKKLLDDLQARNLTDVMHQLAALDAARLSMQKDIATLTQEKETLKSQVASLTSEKDSLKSRMTAVEKRSLAQRSVQFSSCSWTGYVNGWDAHYTYNAPGNTVLAGVESYHDNHSEDRRFRFKYCSLKSPHP